MKLIFTIKETLVEEQKQHNFFEWIFSNIQSQYQMLNMVKIGASL